MTPADVDADPLVLASNVGTLLQAESHRSRRYQLFGSRGLPTHLRMHCLLCHLAYPRWRFLPSIPGSSKVWRSSAEAALGQDKTGVSGIVLHLLPEVLNVHLQVIGPLQAFSP